MLGVFVSVAGCGDPSPQTDAAIDAPIEPSCDLDAAFGAAARVATGQSMRGVWISSDELTAYYDGAFGLSISVRETPTSEFPIGSAAPGFDSTFFDGSTNVDGTVIFVDDHADSLSRFTRATATSDWGSGVVVANGLDPAVSLSNVYFATSAGGLFVSAFSEQDFGTPASVDELSSIRITDPTISLDDLELAFRGDFQPMIARRGRATDMFEPPILLDTQLGGFVEPAGFSADRCRLYVTADFGKAASLYVMSRP